MPARKRKAFLARNVHTLAIGLSAHWRGTIGSVGIGLGLTEVYYTDNPWVTVNYLAQRSAGNLSPDTVRRRLEAMVDEGLVEFIEPDGRRLYKATPKGAEGTIALIEESVQVYDANVGFGANLRVVGTAR